MRRGLDCFLGIVEAGSDHENRLHVPVLDHMIDHVQKVWTEVSLLVTSAAVDEIENIMCWFGRRIQVQVFLSVKDFLHPARLGTGQTAGFGDCKHGSSSLRL